MDDRTRADNDGWARAPGELAQLVFGIAHNPDKPREMLLKAIDGLFREAVESERERCAKKSEGYNSRSNGWGNKIAAAIRARSRGGGSV